MHPLSAMNERVSTNAPQVPWLIDEMQDFTVRKEYQKTIGRKAGVDPSSSETTRHRRAIYLSQRTWRRNRYCPAIAMSLLVILYSTPDIVSASRLDNNNDRHTDQPRWSQIRQHFADRFRLRSPTSTNSRQNHLQKDREILSKKEVVRNNEDGEKEAMAALYAAVARQVEMDKQTELGNQDKGENRPDLSGLYAAMARQAADNHHTSAESMEKDERVPWFRAVFNAIPVKKILEFGIVFYLVWNVAKAASEIVTEYAQELLGTQEGFTNDQVCHVIQFLQLSQSDAKTFLDSPLRDQLHYPALMLARNLAMVGLPLTASRQVHIAGRVPKPSVDSVLTSLTRLELSLLQQSLWVPPIGEKPSSAWDDIVGLDLIKDGLTSAVNSITQQSRTSARGFQSLFKHSAASKGVLLYGPPGCGKSFLIKALSIRSRLPCLVITPSLLLRKYVGDTNQQVRAVFSLAQKLSPCILCIDEVDALFRARSDTEHEVSRDLKTEFLQHLDGMMSSEQISRNELSNDSDQSSVVKRQNLVVAATNRPFDVDGAVLRRLTQSYFVGLPDVAGRIVMLKHFLQDVPTSSTDMDYWELSSRTEGYSPSDLKRLLQEAATSGPLREQERKSSSFSLAGFHGVSHKESSTRPLVTNDILAALRVVPSTHMSAEYRWSLSNFVQSQNMDHSQAMSTSGVPLSSTGSGGMVSKWETNVGNFYNLGHFQIDSETWDNLTDLSEKLIEISMEEESDDDDDDDDETDDEEVE